MSQSLSEKLDTAFTLANDRISSAEAAIQTKKHEDAKKILESFFMPYENKARSDAEVLAAHDSKRLRSLLTRAETVAKSIEDSDLLQKITLLSAIGLTDTALTRQRVASTQENDLSN